MYWSSVVLAGNPTHKTVGVKRRSIGASMLDADFFKAIELPVAECYMVKSAINDERKTKCRSRAMATIVVRNHLYTFVVHDFNEYTIADKEPLK